MNNFYRTLTIVAVPMLLAGCNPFGNSWKIHYREDGTADYAYKTTEGLYCSIEPLSLKYSLLAKKDEVVGNENQHLVVITDTISPWEPHLDLRIGVSAWLNFCGKPPKWIRHKIPRPSLLRNKEV